MIKIYIDKKFINEKKYVFDFIFKDIYGLEYEINFHNNKDYIIEYNHKKIIINNSFFSSIEDDYKYYLDSKLLPTNVSEIETRFSPSGKMLVFYGNTTISYVDNSIIIGNDIVAGIFFMLSLWEEIAINKRDKFDRFDENAGFIKKHNLHHRPIVNEYAETLWNLMISHNFPIQRKKRTYKVYLTHDVDYFLKFKHLGKFLKSLGGDLLKRRSLKSFLKTNKEYLSLVVKKNHKDVFDTFDYLMEISENKNIKSHFYFKAGKIGEEDTEYDIDSPLVKKKITSILDRKHIIGIHPSWTSFNNPEQFSLELDRLKAYCPNITEGRQHFLRFKNPTTWQIWDKNNLKIDSSIGYNSDCGFRAGVCYEYPIFDVIERKQLQLKERPLIIMDSALFCISKDKRIILDFCKTLINTVKSYNGDLVILWHNSNLKFNEWESWDSVYEEIVDYATNK